MACSVVGCTKSHIARGLCVAHYAKWRKYGDPLASRQQQIHGVSLEERFRQYVRKSRGCWAWIGTLDANGYGRLNVKGIPVLAHRIAWTLKFGHPGNLSVLHKCDNPACVRPDHLFLGDQADNMADMHSKGRGRQGVLRGESHGRAKLTEQQVREIRTSPESSREAAKRFGVSSTVIKDLRVRKIWAHVK